MSDRTAGRPRTIDPDRVSLVALRLFHERGYDTVSMDDVAGAAGVSRRSLFRLFPTKASLVWGGLDEFVDRFTAALARQEDAESADLALRRAYEAAARFPAGTVETTRHRLRVISANPALRAEGVGRSAALVDEVVRFIGVRDGLPDHDLSAVVRAHAFAAASGAALAWWAAHDAGRPEAVVARALAHLR